MTETLPHSRDRWRGWLPRSVALFALWVVLSGLDPVALLVGAVTALGATWVSLRLLPAGRGRLRPAALARQIAHLLQQSVIAGCDVAWRALDPRLPIRPGFVRYRPELPAGPGFDAFCTVVGLVPGTLPSGLEQDAIVVHCLDASEAVVAQLAAEKSRLMALIDDGSRHE